MTPIRSRTPFALLASALLASVLPAVAAAGPVRVLLLSGQNNHDWASTTPALKAILEAGGGFLVDVREDPASLTPAALAPYDAILSNWNAFGLDPKKTAWPEPARRAFTDSIRAGRGHVAVHAGGTSFPDWEEYGRIALAAWKDGQTTHGPIHEFAVRVDDPGHPVTAGLAPFKIRDELWNRPGTAAGARVLASSFSASDRDGTGAWEPTVLAGAFGRGRTLTILLGHDAAAMASPDFQVLLRRAVEWAATGRVTARAALPALAWGGTDGETLEVRGPKGPLWVFRYGAGLDMPYFHPLNTADGRTLTRDRPPDHLWHHGLWFSWKFINGVNYWEIDGKTGRPAGTTSRSNVEIRRNPDFSARIGLDLDYRPAGSDKPVLVERRVVEVGPPDAAGVYALDWTCAFEAVQAAVLDRTPIPGEPGAQAWGGYAGLSLRLTGDWTERLAVTSDGPITEMPDDRHRGRHTAVDYAGLLNGSPAGIAILAHPLNPGAPSPWYVIRSAEMSFFSPAVLGCGPMTLRPGSRFVLRYRVLVHPGRWDAARLKAEYARYIGSN